MVMKLSKSLKFLKAQRTLKKTRGQVFQSGEPIFKYMVSCFGVVCVAIIFSRAYLCSAGQFQRLWFLKGLLLIAFFFL